MQRHELSEDCIKPMLLVMPPSRTRFQRVVDAPTSWATVTVVSLALNQLRLSRLANAVLDGALVTYCAGTQKVAVSLPLPQ
jgi:hypothetical protein